MEDVDKMPSGCGKPTPFPSRLVVSSYRSVSQEEEIVLELVI